MKIYFFLVLCFFYTSQSFCSEIFWERNVTVRQTDPTGINTFAAVLTKVNINVADKKSLLKLNGIGPKKAEAIIEYRSQHGAFKSVQDLSKVRGITAKVLTKLIEKNKEMLVVSD